ncbi:MAG: glutaredoxin family protein [Myxococcaceae bacterium]|nr:glutaredoxin family protein [Myxococcaceae bacterium]
MGEGEPVWDGPTVVLYGKPGCPLCDEAREVLDEAAETRHFRLEPRNILERDEWFAAFRYRVPVVEVEGIVRLELRFSLKDVHDVLSSIESEAS